MPRSFWIINLCLVCNIFWTLERLIILLIFSEICWFDHFNRFWVNFSQNKRTSTRVVNVWVFPSTFRSSTGIPTLPDFSALFQINKLIFKRKKLRLSTYHIPKMDSREPENRVLGPLKPTDHWKRSVCVYYNYFFRCWFVMKENLWEKNIRL